MKPILPTLKERKRYLAFEIISKEPIKDFKAISDEITTKSLELIGKLGVAKAGIQILAECYNANKGLIRINHNHVDEIKSALTLVKEINKTKVTIKSLGVSGILNKAKEKYIQ